MRKLASSYWFVQGVGVFGMAVTLLAIWLNVSNLLEFHEHAAWSNWLGCLALPLLAYNIVGMTRNIFVLRKMRRDHARKMQQLYDAHRRWLDRESAELERAFADIERTDPERAASLRRRLAEAEQALERAKPK